MSELHFSDETGLGAMQIQLAIAYNPAANNPFVGSEGRLEESVEFSGNGSSTEMVTRYIRAGPDRLAFLQDTALESRAPFPKTTVTRSSPSPTTPERLETTSIREKRRRFATQFFPAVVPGCSRNLSRFSMAFA